jgi:peptidoglycan hydrolase-like protein with peptidoglycan-binding domain
MNDKTPVKNPSQKTAPARRSALSLELKHNLAQGDIGGQVKTAQDALIKHGFTEFKTDGRYGSLMGKAVRRFQDSRGLRVTGEIDSYTWEALFQSDPIKKIKE